MRRAILYSLAALFAYLAWRCLKGAGLALEARELWQDIKTRF